MYLVYTHIILHVFNLAYCIYMLLCQYSETCNWIFNGCANRDKGEDYFSHCSNKNY